MRFDNREREIVRRMAEREGCSMGEVVRRIVRSHALNVIDPKAFDRPGSAPPPSSGEHAHY